MNRKGLVGALKVDSRGNEEGAGCREAAGQSPADVITNTIT